MKAITFWACPEGMRQQMAIFSPHDGTLFVCQSGGKFASTHGLLAEQRISGVTK